MNIYIYIYIYTILTLLAHLDHLHSALVLQPGCFHRVGIPQFHKAGGRCCQGATDHSE